MLKQNPLRFQAPRSPRVDSPSLFLRCPADLEPIVHPAPEFPPYSDWRLSVTVRFFVDTDGMVLVPSVLEAKFSVAGQVEKIPPNFERAIVDAIARWRFPPQSNACSGSITRTFSHAV
jgi:hypothetical protein